MAAKDVRTIGRATQGVRLIDIDPEDRVVSVARLAEKRRKKTKPIPLRHSSERGFDP